MSLSEAEVGAYLYPSHKGEMDQTVTLQSGCEQ